MDIRDKHRNIWGKAVFYTLLAILFAAIVIYFILTIAEPT